jgi:acyl carrier protein
MDNIKVGIADCVAMVLQMDPENVKKLSGETSLTTIGVDSFNCMDIIVNIESHFDIEFDDEDLFMDNLRTLDRLHKIVSKKLNCA